MLKIPGNVFRRRLDILLPMAQKAHGIFIEDENQKRYCPSRPLDFKLINNYNTLLFNNIVDL
ncbi:MAG: hypothetical protein PF503_08460 [Desulfobacula sp.]|jgi:hypothetical protein|nr:hypothetical protein [Desulfobacula sp.]